MKSSLYMTNNQITNRQNKSLLINKSKEGLTENKNFATGKPAMAIGAGTSFSSAGAPKR